MKKWLGVILLLNLVTMTNCTLTRDTCTKEGVATGCLGKISGPELTAITSTPFNANAESTVANGVKGEQTGFDPNIYRANPTPGTATFDAIPPSNGLIESDKSKLFPIRVCDPANEKEEYKEAIEKVKVDPSLIIVKYTFTAGTAADGIAKYANERAILNANPAAKYHIFAAPLNGYDFSTYYEGDPSDVREQYYLGKRCFYSVMKVEEKSNYSANVSGDWHKTMSNYGTVLDIASTPPYEINQRALYNNRFYVKKENLNYSIPDTTFPRDDFSVNLTLPENWPLKNTVPVYVFDYRKTFTDPSFLSNLQFSSGERGLEQFMKLAKIFNLKSLFLNLDTIYNQISVDKVINGISFSGMRKAAIPQTLYNLYSQSAQGKIIPFAYTPLVLDLGTPYLYTSSISFGTYFNLANLLRGLPTTQVTKEKAMGYQNFLTQPSTDVFPVEHATAWLGGELTNTGTNENPNWKIQSDDGFLVSFRNDTEKNYIFDLIQNDPLGAQISGNQLYGDHRVSATGQFYTDGFQALREEAGKESNSAADVEKRYILPGDPTYKKLYMWVDKNRDGRINKGELKTLAESKIAAINTNAILSDHLKDFAGNETSLRTAFLLTEDLDLDSYNDKIKAEILYRLNTGKTSTDSSAEFRLILDIKFQNNILKYPLDVPSEEVRSWTDFVRHAGG